MKRIEGAVHNGWVLPLTQAKSQEVTHPICSSHRTGFPAIPITQEVVPTCPNLSASLTHLHSLTLTPIPTPKLTFPLRPTSSSTLPAVTRLCTMEGCCFSCRYSSASATSVATWTRLCHVSARSNLWSPGGGRGNRRGRGKEGRREGQRNEGVGVCAHVNAC